jgi:hypothetical protein
MRQVPITGRLLLVNSAFHGEAVGRTDLSWIATEDHLTDCVEECGGVYTLRHAWCAHQPLHSAISYGNGSFMAERLYIPERRINKFYEIAKPNWWDDSLQDFLKKLRKPQ